MAGSNEVRIEKLGKTNWKTWIFQIRNILDEKDAWEVVSGVLKQPTVPDPSDRTAVAQYTADYKTWLKPDKIARKYLSTTVGEDALQLILNCDTAREMYLKLETQYAGSTALRKMEVMKS